MAQLQHDSPKTALGQLQRGRGEGYLRILNTPLIQARQMVEDCISHDPRLNRQVESRQEYYAELAIKVGLDLAPLARHLRENDEADQSGRITGLTVTTLTELAKRSYQDASEILCDYIAWGQGWDWPLRDLLQLPDENIHVKIANAIERHFPNDNDLLKAVGDFYADSLPWNLLVRKSLRIGALKDRFRNAVEKTPGSEFSPGQLESLTPADLLRLVNKTNRNQFRPIILQTVKPADVTMLIEHVSLDKPVIAEVALASLARLAPENIFEWIKQFYFSNPQMKGILCRRSAEVMAALPSALTLPLARDGLFNDSPHHRYLAEQLFNVHATEEDIPVLRRAIREGLSDEETNCYRLCNVIEAFGRFPNIGLIPELFEAFTDFKSSYGRNLAAKALNITAPQQFRESLAEECLWDCETHTQELGAECTALNKESTTERLREIATDKWRDETVRETAKKRLAIDDAAITKG